MASKKSQPIEHFARTLEAIELGLQKCGPGTDPCIRTAMESAKKNLLAGLDSYKEQQAADAEVFTLTGAYSILRGVDYEKANEVLEKLSTR